MKMQEFQNEGYVYFLTNPLFPYGLVKIGIAKDIVKRVIQLSTSVPYDYQVCMLMKSKKYKQIERILHIKYAKKRVNREFFMLSEKEILEIKSEYQNIILKDNDIPRGLVEKTDNHFNKFYEDVCKLYSFYGEKINYNQIKKSLINDGYSKYMIRWLLCKEAYSGKFLWFPDNDQWMLIK